jgi:hypothetical protein
LDAPRLTNASAAPPLPPPSELKERGSAERAGRLAARAEPRAPSAPAAREATLRVRATPWAELMLDGRGIGATPLPPVGLSVGPHVLLAKHPPDPDKRLPFVVRPGESRLINVDFTKERHAVDK